MNSVENALRDFTVAMIRSAVDALEDSRSRLDGLDEARDRAEEPERAAWRPLRLQAENSVHQAEASLAYLLESTFSGVAPGRPPVDEGPFRPFGVVADGIAYVVREDPANMCRGIVVRVDMGMLVDLDDQGDDDEDDPPASPPSDADQMAMTMIRELGERETKDRLLLCGPYQVIWDVLGRLGGDAVGELRRLIELGEPIARPAADGEQG